jgi:quinol-cytochrome oxidoreductase complex cytochrome b subunit
MSGWASANWPPSRATRPSPSTPNPSGTTGAASRSSSFSSSASPASLLLVYYRPGAEAFESVRQITFVMHFGWLIRSAHAWSANLMIFSILVHMFSVYFMKAYRKPREFGWLSGMALIGHRLGLRLLRLPAAHGRAQLLRHQGRPADSRGHSLRRRGIANMLRGGPDVSEFTVQRFFALHVVVLPAIFLPLARISSLA